MLVTNKTNVNTHFPTIMEQGRLGTQNVLEGRERESSRWSVSGGSRVGGGDKGRQSLGSSPSRWCHQGLDGHPARWSLARPRHHWFPERCARGELGGSRSSSSCRRTLAELNSLLTSAAHEQNLLWGVPVRDIRERRTIHTGHMLFVCKNGRVVLTEGGTWGQQK